MEDPPLYTLSALDFNHYYGKFCLESRLSVFPGWRCPLGGIHSVTVDLHLFYESVVGRGGADESDPDDVWWAISQDATLGPTGARGPALPREMLITPKLMREIYRARIYGFIQYMANLVRRFEQQQTTQQPQQQQGYYEAQRLQAQQAEQQQQQQQQQRQQLQAQQLEQQRAQLLAAAMAEQQRRNQRRQQEAAAKEAAAQQKRARSKPVGTPEPVTDTGEPPAKRTRGQQQQQAATGAGGSTTPPAAPQQPRHAQQPPPQQQQQQRNHQHQLPAAADIPDPIPGDRLRSMATWLRSASLSLIEGPEASAAIAALSRRYRPDLARLRAAMTAALPPELYPVFGARPPPRLTRAPRAQPTAATAAPAARLSRDRSSSSENEMGVIRLGPHAQATLPAYLGPAPPPSSTPLASTESRYLSESRPVYTAGEEDRAASSPAARAGARRAARADVAPRSSAPVAPEERRGRSLARGRVGMQLSYADFARAMAQLGSEQQRQDLLRGALEELDEEMGPDLVQRLGLTDLGYKLRAGWNGVDEALFAMGMLWHLRPKKAVQREYLPNKTLHELQSYYYNVWKLRGTPLADYYYELEPYERKTATDRRLERSEAAQRAQVYDAKVEHVLAAERTKMELELDQRSRGSNGDSGSGGGSGGGDGDSNGGRDGSGGGGGAGDPAPPRREAKGQKGPRSRGASPPVRKGGGGSKQTGGGGGATANGAAVPVAGGIAPRRPAPVKLRRAGGGEALAQQEPPAAKTSAAVATEATAATGPAQPQAAAKQQVQAATAAAAAKAEKVSAPTEPPPRGSDSSAATQSPAHLPGDTAGDVRGGSEDGGEGGNYNKSDRQSRATVIRIPASLLVPGPDGRSSLATGTGAGTASTVPVLTSPRQEQKQAVAVRSEEAAAAATATEEEEPPPRRLGDPRKRPPSWWQQGSASASPQPTAGSVPPPANEPSGLNVPSAAHPVEAPEEGAAQQQGQQQQGGAKQQQQQTAPITRKGRGSSVRITWGRRRPNERHLTSTSGPTASGGSSGPSPLPSAAASAQAVGPASPPAVVSAGRAPAGSVLLVASPGAPGSSPKLFAVLPSRAPVAVPVQQATPAQPQQEQQQQQTQPGPKEEQQPQQQKKQQQPVDPSAGQPRSGSRSGKGGINSLRRVRAWLMAAARDPVPYVATAPTSSRAARARRAREVQLAACPAEWSAQLQQEVGEAVAAAAAAMTVAGAVAKRAVSGGDAGSGGRRSPRQLALAGKRSR